MISNSQTRCKQFQALDSRCRKCGALDSDFGNYGRLIQALGIAARDPVRSFPPANATRSPDLSERRARRTHEINGSTCNGSLFLLWQFCRDVGKDC